MSTQEVENVKQVKLDFDAECPSCSATIEFNPATSSLHIRTVNQGVSEI